ncbi:hypothetical protein [Puia dinghuensis]|nr:hypothetical protein [Puia dinghuensis]
MKQFSLLTFTVLICTLAQAQIKKGDIVLGGNLYYSNQTQTISSGNGSPYSTKYQSITIAPSFGKVVKDNLVLGFDVAYTYDNSNDGQGDKTNGNGFAAGIFLRKYRSIGNGFYLFGQTRLSGNYLHSAQDEPANNNVITSNVTDSYGFNLQFFPGIAYAINQKWQLELALTNFFAVNYTHTKQNLTYTNQPDYHYSGSTFGAASSLTGNNTYTIGLRYFIGS